MCSLQDNTISESDLAELEACDEWVSLMVELEMSETEHLIEYARANAPAAAQYVEQQVLGKH